MVIYKYIKFNYIYLYTLKMTCVSNINFYRKKFNKKLN